MATKKSSAAESEYLDKIIKANTLDDESQEMKDLRATRERVEATLREELGDDPHIVYGGSHAKGTMVATSYDLDLRCYFPRDADEAGETLESLWASTKAALEKKYTVVPKRSALRVLDKEGKSYLHVDVVPGRYVDDAKSDVFLHQNEGEKVRLKTNPEKHTTHVRDSGVRPAIKLAKIWRDRHGIAVKTFVLELLVIKILDGRAGDALDVQLRTLVEEFRDRADTLSVVDPANGGNDLSAILDDARYALKNAAESALLVVEEKGWEGVFGAVPEDSSASATAQPQRIAALASQDCARVKPWAA